MEFPIRWDFVSSWDSTKQLIPALSSFPGFFDWKTPCQDLAKAEGRDFKSEAFVKSAMSDGHVAHAASAKSSAEDLESSADQALEKVKASSAKFRDVSKVEGFFGWTANEFMVLNKFREGEMMWNVKVGWENNTAQYSVQVFCFYLLHVASPKKIHRWGTDARACQWDGRWHCFHSWRRNAGPWEASA